MAPPGPAILFFTRRGQGWVGNKYRVGLVVSLGLLRVCHSWVAAVSLTGTWVSNSGQLDWYVGKQMWPGSAKLVQEKNI